MSIGIQHLYFFSLYLCIAEYLKYYTYSRAIDNSPAPKQNAVKMRTAVEKLKL